MAEAKITTRLDSSGFKRGMKQINGSVDKFDNKLAGLKSKLAMAFSVVTVVRMVKAFVFATSSAAASVEDLIVQFNVLFGSVNRAVKRVEDLKAFSAATPFQLEDIANASQTLEVFSEGILGGVDDLKIFGDAAAAVGQKDLKDVSYWVGRFYASLQSGRPILDSVNALSRLKLMGPTVTKELLDMRAASADANVIWAAFTDSLKRFEGGMDEMSKTTSGKLSTMKDNWTLAFAAMGDVFEPLTKKAIDASTKIANLFEKEANLYKRMFKFIGVMSNPLGGALSKIGQETEEETEEEEQARKAAKIKEFEDKRAAEKKTAAEQAQFEEFQKADAKADAERAKEIEKRLKITDDAKEALIDDAKVALNAAEQIADIRKSARIENVSGDRLTQIGGALGGAISPQLQVARRALQVQENIAKVLADLPPRIAQELINLGAYE